MSKKIPTTILAALFIFGALFGLQINQEHTFHIMDGQLMSDHEMPISDCGQDGCIMLSSTASIMHMSSIQVPEIKNSIALKVFLLTFLILSVNLLIQKKNTLSLNFRGPPDFKTATVILRE